MTLEIVILNQKRTFAISDSTVTIDDCKTYDGEQKIFKISDRLSTVLLLSGNSELDGQKLKNFIDEYVSKTNFNEITSVDEIKDTLNDSIAESSQILTPSDYVKSTFPEFERNIKQSIEKIQSKDQIIQFLKLNSSEEEFDFLIENNSLKSNINRLANSLFSIKNKDEYEMIKFYLKQTYFNFLISNSPNIVLVGYDEVHENPTYVNYAILFNNSGKLETIEIYSVHNCVSTMIFSIAQDDDVDLVLTGFNKNTFSDIRNVILELFYEFGNLGLENQVILNSISEKLKIKINQIKLNNIENIMNYIRMLPDSEIFKLLDALIVLTSIKMKFSSEVHSVGEKQSKVVLRKYNDILFIE